MQANNDQPAVTSAQDSGSPPLGNLRQDSGPAAVGFGVVLAFAMAMSTVTQNALGVLAPFLTDELGITLTQLGGLTSVLYLVGAVTGPMAGAVVDALGGRRSLISLFVLATVALLLIASARSYALLLVAVLFGGVAGALGNPATNQLVYAHVGGVRQGLFVGLKQAGVKAGTFLCGALLPVGAVLLGWRNGLMVAAAVPALTAVAALLVLPATSVAKGAGSSTRGDGAHASTKWLAGYSFLMGAGNAAVLTHFALYAHEHLDMTVSAAGLAIAITGLVGLVARIFWGLMSSTLLSVDVTLAVLALGGVAAQILLWLLSPASTLAVWAGAVLFGATAGSWNAVVHAAIVQTAPFESQGSVTGRVSFFFYAGLMIGPIGFGSIVEQLDSYVIAGVVASCISLVGALLAVLWKANIP